MTTLATHPTTEPDLLDLIALDPTPLRANLAEKFRAACEAEALANDGWVNPNAVRLRLLDDPDYNPRQYSALWSPACGRDGFLRKTDRLVQISGDGSRGNTNKSVLWRRWIGASA